MDLAEITEPDRPYTRRVFTSMYEKGRVWLRQKMEEAGLEVYLDPAANLIGRLPSRNPQARILMVGSHIDTVGNGGRFDGVAGVIAGLEIARCIREQKIEFDHHIEIVDFIGEEPNDWGVSCVGSRGMIGWLKPEMLNYTNSVNIPLSEVLKKSGADLTMLTKPLRQQGEIAAFLEMHIEQGPVLENELLDVGIVTDIAGIKRVEVCVEGRADHAGTTPMHLRKDALVTASKIVLWIKDEALKMSRWQDGYFVATVGRVTVTPNGPNVVPSKVQLVVDIRSNREEWMNEFALNLEDVSMQISRQDDLEIKNVPLTNSPPTLSADSLLTALEEISGELGIRNCRMSSGAGHDAAYVAKIAPMAMVFIPCKGGRSHTPEEWSDEEQVSRGAELIFETLKKLDKKLARS